MPREGAVPEDFPAPCVDVSVGRLSLIGGSVDPHLNARFRQRRLRGETLARRHAGVVRPLELFLEFLQLLRAEGRAIAPELGLLRAV